MYSVWVSWHDMFCIFLEPKQLQRSHVMWFFSEALYRWHGTYAFFCFFTLQMTWEFAFFGYVRQLPCHLQVLYISNLMLASFEQHKIAQICTNSDLSKIKKELTIPEQTNSATSPLIQAQQWRNNCIHHWEGHFLTSTVLRHVDFGFKLLKISRGGKNKQVKPPTSQPS